MERGPSFWSGRWQAILKPSLFHNARKRRRGTLGTRVKHGYGVSGVGELGEKDPP
ncbi:MAG: hypothetical protein DHS20C03_37820 [Minwuia thermotolerans]|nr:MAG: hypothetical protein DHS20C03_37820 [Minwuia thermotolerans]